MKRFLTTATVGLCMFVLGLAAASQPKPKPGAKPPTRGTEGNLNWQRQGQNLKITHRTKGAAHLVVGIPSKAGKEISWTYKTGEGQIAMGDLDKAIIFKVEEILECDDRECRKCNQGACPIPPPPPDPIFMWVN